MFSFDPQRPGLIQRILTGAPPALARVLCNLAGSVLHAADFDSVRTSSVPVVQRALGCSTLQAHAIVRAAMAETLISYADVAYLLSRPVEQLQARGKAACTIDGLQHVEAALARGTGAILFSAHFGCMYLGAMQRLESERLQAVPMGLLMRVVPGLDDLVKKLSQVCGRQLYLIDADDEFVARDLVVALRRNHVVACMFDFFYEASSLVVSDFLGDVCATPGGMGRVAAHTGCALLPQFTFRRGGRYHTTIGAPVELPADGTLDERTYAATDLMNRCIESEIRRRPGEWTFWRGLERRREWAAAALGAPA